MREMAVALLTLILSFTGCTFITEEIPEVGLLPKIHEFGATPSVIGQGEIAYLRWSVSNADTVFIDNGIGNVALKGTMPVSPNNTAFYTLTARNFAGEAAARTQIIVRSTQTTHLPVPPVTQPTIVSFYADRLIITPGDTVTLSWEVLGASEVTLSPIGRVNTRDTITLSPATTTTYVLTATNPAGKSEAGITITVQTSLPPAPKGDGMIILTAIPQESGALVRGTGYMDYTRYDSACAGDTALFFTTTNWDSVMDMLCFDNATLTVRYLISQ